MPATLPKQPAAALDCTSLAVSLACVLSCTSLPELLSGVSEGAVTVKVKLAVMLASATQVTVITVSPAPT